MKLKFKYEWQEIKKLFFYLLFTFPVLPINLTHLIFSLYAFLVILVFLKEKQSIQFKTLFGFVLLTLPFVPYIVELCLYPKNQVMQFETEKKLLFFIAPFIFYMDSRLKNKNDTGLALGVFILKRSLLSFISCIYLVFTQKVVSQAESAVQAFQLRQSFEEFSGLHPSYYGLFSSLTTLWILASYKNYSGKLKILLTISLIFLILLNLLIASKMAIIILLLGSFYLIYRNTSKKAKVVLFSSLFAVAMLVLIYFIPSLNSRFSEIPAYFTHQTIDNTVVERTVIFKCSKAIFVSNFLSGIGARNTQAVLDYSYVLCGYNKGAMVHLNSHNQFLTIGLNYGLGIMLLFVLILVFYFRKSKKSLLANLFWFSLVLMMFTESILERQMGIYCFLFFALLFHSAQKQDDQRAYKI